MGNSIDNRSSVFFHGDIGETGGLTANSSLWTCLFNDDNQDNHDNKLMCQHSAVILKIILLIDL